MAAQRLADARRSGDADAIEQARGALTSARMEAAQAARTAMLQGSGAPGDRPRQPGESGQLVNVIA